MLREERFDTFAIHGQLLVQGPQHHRQRAGQQTAGGNHSRGARELVCARKDLQSALVRCGAVKLLRVQKLFPGPLAGLDQRLRGGDPLPRLVGQPVPAAAVELRLGAAGTVTRTRSGGDGTGAGAGRDHSAEVAEDWRVVLRNTRRIQLRLSSSYPDQRLFGQVVQALGSS